MFILVAAVVFAARAAETGLSHLYDEPAGKSRVTAKSQPSAASTAALIQRPLHSCPGTKDRVPLIAFFAKGGKHCPSPEALPSNFRLSHPSQKLRKMGHPISCGNSRLTLLCDCVPQPVQKYPGAGSIGRLSQAVNSLVELRAYPA